MKNSVSWKEGMFLLPQHFQCQEQHFERQLGHSAFVDHPFNYGISKLKINEEALQNWQFAIDHASGRSRRGDLFDFIKNEIPRIDLRTFDDGELKKRLDNGAIVKLYLAFPLPRPNVKNISDSESGSNSRYHEYEKSIFELLDVWNERYEEYEKPAIDLHEVGNDKSIVLKSLRAIITTDNSRDQDYDYLEIAQLELKGSEAGQVPSVSTQFIPASMYSGSSEVSRMHYQKMWDQLGSYLINLVEYLEPAGFSISLIADSECSASVYRYIQLSEFRAWLAHQLNSPGDHPHQCFEYLCRLIGRLSITDPKIERLVNYLHYDHENIYKSLEWAFDMIRRNFVPPSVSNIRRIPFIAERMQTESGEELIMKATLTPELFESNWSLYLGFDTDYGRMTDDDRKLFFTSYLRNGSIFYWKLGSHEKINDYFINRDKGVEWKNASRTKEGLPRRGSWYYADIVQDRFWDPVKQSGTICLRIDQGNLRTPASDLGTERITVGINQRTYQYRVSIFAVRQDDG